jgi:hypothetical protein
MQSSVLMGGMKRRRFLAGFHLSCGQLHAIFASGVCRSLCIVARAGHIENSTERLAPGRAECVQCRSALVLSGVHRRIPADGLPYLDDDLAVRDVSGGFELLRSEVTAPHEITGWVKDRSWDRFSRVMLTAKDAHHLSDIGFRGAPAPATFSMPRATDPPIHRA